MFFRNRRLVRGLASYLLLQTLSSVFGPVAALAGNGPNQPEFTSYNPGNSDLVDLLTGDFSYSIPLLEVPGPERSFAIPLSYKSGIKLEQEASWVGLGWTLNAGAISRTPNGYPDDAAGEKVQTHFLKHVGAVQKVNYIPGVWNQTTELYTGKKIGQVDLIGLAGVNWDNDGIAGGDLIGVGYQKGEGATMDPVRLTLGALTIMSFGGAFAAKGAATQALGAQLTESFAGQVGIGAATNALGLGKLSGAQGAGNQLQVYEFSRGSIAATFVPLASIFTDYQTDYTYSLYGQNTNETAYGSLYFGKMSQATKPVLAKQPISSFGTYVYVSHNRPQLVTSTGAAIAPVEFNNTRLCKAPLDDAEGPGSHLQETAADIHQPAGTAYQNVDGPGKPISIAHDYFSVMGGAASGLIRPYRLDVGSVTLAASQAQDCDADTKYMAVPFQDYKVGFRYEGDLSNTYDYHQNTDPADIGFEVSADKRSIKVTDQRLFEATLRTAPTRKGIINGPDGPRFVQGKNVQWFSNREIEQMGNNQAASEFLDFAPPVADAATANVFRHKLPPAGIGAFKITTEDGTIYHYSLPVYEYKTNIYSKEVNGSYKTMYGLPGEYYKKQGEPTANNPHGGYATTWLLTAVTSSDYIDRNSSGTVDAQDWGGWVKLEYGKFSSQYKWRQPYIGYSYSDETTYIDYANYMEGYRESYYLDRVSTRTHTALFVKSIRQDGKGHFDPDYATKQNQPKSSDDQLHDMGINEQFPASSLRLDEIILLDNAALTQLQAPDPGLGNSWPVFNNNTGNNASSSSCGTCGDDLAGVLDGGDITANTQMRQFVEANALKRVHFNYTYDLCPGTPNSFSYILGQSGSLPPMTEAQASVNRTGKLTLRSVSFFGPTVAGKPTKIIPDFLFGYDTPGVASEVSNPTYQKDKWDAFGMYNSLGKYDVASHQPNKQDFPAPWTLTSITNPLGGMTRITYERDDYARVSEKASSMLSFRTNGLVDANDNTVLTISKDELAKIDNKLQEVFPVKSRVVLDGFVKYVCTDENGNKQDMRQDIHTAGSIVDVTSSSVTVTGALVAPACGGTAQIQLCVLNTSLPLNKPGGDVRVAALTTTEPESGAHYDLRYKYTTGSNLMGSTGVIAQTAPFAPLYFISSRNNYDYPQTPVLYSSVSVLHGPFRNDEELKFNHKEVFEFYTPVSTMLSQDLPDVSTSGYWNEATQQNDGVVSFNNNRITVNTGLIGRPKRVRTYNQQGQLELSTDFLYSNQAPNLDNIAKQGYYTEGVLANHMLNNSHYAINRTTKVYEPTVLVGTSSMRNSITSTGRSILFDFFTGQTVETATTNSMGRVYHTRTIPAYTLPGQTTMGPKGIDGANRNMLIQPGASYSFIEVLGGSPYNPLAPFNSSSTHMLSADVQTWRPTWNNYREPDATGTYQDVAGQPAVWRQASVYAWQAPALASDGSIKDFVPFVWTGTPDVHWLKTSEAVRYDHYSHSLEARDVNGRYIAQKMGYNQTQLIASASNARYTELAYSGAEDPFTVGGVSHFGSEVIAGGTADNQLAHTGFYSNKLLAAQIGFCYKAQAGRDIDVGKTYRLSVWAHANAPSGKLYASYNGIRIAEVARSSSNTKKAGAWYLMTLLVTIPPAAKGQMVEFGCLNAGTGAGNFDDFRIAPLTATVTAKVYDPRTTNLLYSLDNDNLFTHYEYTSGGRLKRIYQETLDGTGPPHSATSAERLVKEYDYNYAQMRVPNWLDLGTACATNSSGQTTGYLVHTYQDINTESPTYNQVRMDYSTALSAKCPAIACSGFDRYNNVTQSCESPALTLIYCYEESNKHWGVYRYLYKDGSPCLEPTGNPVEYIRVVPNWQQVCP